MSLSISLNNALSGLSVQARAASVVSSNVANATTEGYGRRQIEIGTNGVSGGARVDGVTRNVDEAVIRDRRSADAGFGYSNTRSTYLGATLDLVGAPDAAGGLSERLRLFEGALLEAAGRPDEPARLANALNTAQTLVDGVNDISDGIQALRQDADQDIARQVAALNAGVEAVRDLNASITALSAQGRDANALYDERQRAIDQISEIVPLRALPRDDGTVALITDGGALLLESTPRTVGFAHPSWRRQRSPLPARVRLRPSRRRKRLHRRAFRQPRQHRKCPPRRQSHCKPSRRP